MPVLRPPTVSDGEVTVSRSEQLPAAVARVEFELIKTALAHHQGSVDAAAKALGISRKGLYLKRQRLGL
jgi:DNA-binding NtrC family response regulator